MRFTQHKINRLKPFFLILMKNREIERIQFDNAEDFVLYYGDLGATLNEITVKLRKYYDEVEFAQNEKDAKSIELEMRLDNRVLHIKEY